MEITKMTPVEVDTIIAEAEGRLALAHARLDRAIKAVERFDRPGARAWGQTREGLVADVTIHEETIRLVNEELAPYRAEYRRCPWTRAFLVTNAGGHVHRDTNCTTCYFTTQYHWLVDQAGKDEAEIVDLAGERACTVCYPTAPVEVRQKPTRLFTPTEVEQQKERERRAAQRVAKAQAAVLKPGTTEVLYKTVRGATNELAGWAHDLIWYGPEHPTFDYWDQKFNELHAILIIRGEDIPTRDEYLEKARKKAVAEKKKYEKTAQCANFIAQGLYDPTAPAYRY